MKCREELHRPDRIHQGCATMAMTGERDEMEEEEEEEGRKQGVEKSTFEVEDDLAVSGGAPGRPLVTGDE